MKQKPVTPSPIPTDAFDATPRLAVLVASETLYLMRLDGRGQPVAIYPVAPADVAAAFNPFGADTGLLPEGALFWQNVAGSHRIGVWLPPSKRALSFSHRKPARIPLPGFVFVGRGTQYSIWAARSRPSSPKETLYMAPLPNVGHDGSICAGNVKFPVCAPGTIHRAAEMFFESEFNSDLADRKVRQSGSLISFLMSLSGRRSFPADQLVTCNTRLERVLRRDDGDPDDDRPNIDEHGVVHLDPNEPAPDLATWMGRPFIMDEDDDEPFGPPSIRN